MNDVLLFAGTTEGRRIIDACRGKNVMLHVSTTTEYGQTLIEEAENVRVLPGRKDAVQIGGMITETGAKLVIDATHPYASSITQTLKTVCGEKGADYLRVLRSEDHTETENCVFVSDTAEAVAYLNAVSGNVLLTIGSKELPKYAGVYDAGQRVYARILALPATVEQACSLGIDGSHLICMQGPFSEELNIALLRAINAKYLVTKDTGKEGGFAEKIRAAKACGVIPIVLRRPDTEEGIGCDECIRILEERFGFSANKKKDVVIVGVGAGSEGSMTLDGENACREAELLVGAKRLTDGLKRFGKAAVNAVTAQDIADILHETDCQRIAVVMSGDTGFYSGTKKLLPLLSDLDPRVLPGISSLAYFCSRVGTSWDDAVLISTHGRSCNYLAKIRKNRKVLALTGGKCGPAEIIAALNESGM
ncbi:MAG: precorrin-6A reductase, partial [Firmicutes bacterium]|nr:precorrin-6A reductase [Bacillota bacterium]